MKIIARLKYWFLIVWLSSKWMFRITIGDDVLYNGEKYFVNNGVSAPAWDLLSYSTPRRGVCVHERNFKKIWSLKGLIRSFRSGYWFYMTSWYNIWVRQGIEPWMRGCNIW